jgi:anti-sigma factor RsiW
MNSCPFHDWIGAYHDGELDESRRAQMDQHLEACPPCAAELAELKKLSGLFVETELPRLSPMAMRRLHRRLDAAADEGVIRLARVASALAACILVAAAVALMRLQPSQTPAAEPPWVGIASTGTDSTSVEAATPAAAWYLSNATARADEEGP